MKIKQYLNKKGVIALTIVIIVSAILLAGGVNLMLGNIDLTRAAINYRSQTINEIRANSCFEESIFLIKKNSAYEGNLELTFPNGNCTAVVEDSGPSIKTIEIVGNYYEYEYGRTYQVNISAYPYLID